MTSETTEAVEKKVVDKKTGVEPGSAECQPMLYPLGRSISQLRDPFLTRPSQAILDHYKSFPNAPS